MSRETRRINACFGLCLAINNFPGQEVSAKSSVACSDGQVGAFQISHLGLDKDKPDVTSDYAA